MYIKFNNLSSEKQETIIYSAIEEFSQNGYHKASTEKIASNANIAKGSLFHYFKNKKNLYLFIVKYCINFISEKIRSEANNLDSDIFYERIKFIFIYKQNIFLNYPMQTKICLDIFTTSNNDIKDDLNSLISEYIIDNKKFMEDYILKYMNNKFLRSNVSIEDTFFIINTIFEALSKKYLHMYKEGISLDYIFNEFDKYIDILKYGLYKNSSV